MANGQLFAKVYLGPEGEMNAVVDLIKQTPKLDGLEATLFRKTEGEQLSLSLFKKIVVDRVPFSLEYGFSDDSGGKNAIDFLDPKKDYMKQFVFDQLIPIANETCSSGINFHLVGEIISSPSGKIPKIIHSREEILSLLRNILSDFQKKAGCPITVENIYGLFNNEPDFSIVGRTPQDLFDLNWPVCFDTSHFGQSFFAYQSLYALESAGLTKKVEGLGENFLWYSLEGDESQQKPLMVKFGARERDIVQLLPLDLTEAIMVVLKKLYERKLLRAVHLSNLEFPKENDLSLLIGSDHRVSGAIDLPRILNFAYWDLGVRVVAEIKEKNYYDSAKSTFRQGLLRVVKMLRD